VHARALSLLALPVLLALPAPASAATLTADRACYPAGADGRIVGEGFLPEVPWTATLDGAAAGSGTTTATGAVDVDLSAPEPTGSGREQAYDLTIGAGSTSASVRFRASRTEVTLKPSSGRPGTWRARFKAVGFGAGARLWLHRVDPRGRNRGDVALGTATGACGGLRSPMIRVLPRGARSGTWKLTVDTTPVRGTSGPRVVVKVAVG
jgi:hypothetical protein